jgi:hypothetical protein
MKPVAHTSLRNTAAAVMASLVAASLLAFASGRAGGESTDRGVLADAGGVLAGAALWTIRRVAAIHGTRFTAC